MEVLNREKICGLDSRAGYDGGTMVSSFVDAVFETPILK